MKTIASALLALSLLTGFVASIAPASADFAQDLDREGRLGHMR